ncbi:hypothetical protein ACFWRG_00880 [Micromonospora tulbaghiae]|uniref:hypothetical protein n=1 Tax=Micromonospora tulbaghiae TaxID=479978 RepID=UPI0033C7ED45
MSSIAFSDDEFRLPLYHVNDARYEALGSWLITEISVSFSACLAALALVDDASNGRAPVEEWDSDSFDVHVDGSRIGFQNRLVESQHGEYSVPEVRDAVERYWGFLVDRPERGDLIREYRPDLPWWQAELLQWEERWGRPHPYRGRLF